MYGIGRAGIYLSQSEDISVSSNLIRGVQENGIFDDGSSRNVAMTTNMIFDAGRAGVDTNGRSAGIFIGGGVERFINGNTVKGDPSKMQYGLYIAGGDQSTMTVRSNYFGGAKEYGARFKSPPEPLQYFGENKLEGARGNDRGVSVPETLQRGTQEHIYFGTAVPTSGAWPLGAVVWNRHPAAGGYMGWVNTAAGSPGTWKTFAPVSP